MRAPALALLVLTLRLSAGDQAGFGGDWTPLESRDGLGLDVQEEEPLRRLAHGEISCVIVRNVLSQEQAAEVLARLAERDLVVRGERGKQAFGRRGGGRFAEVGVTIHGSSPVSWAKQAHAQNELFAALFHELPKDPVKQLHAVLGNLAAGSGKRVVVPPNMTGHGVNGTGAIIRMHGPVPGSAFSPHFDGFIQGPYTGRNLRRAREFAVQSSSYTTHSCFSTVLILQSAADTTNPATRVYNASLDELLDERGHPRPKVNGGHHEVGVHFNPQIYEFFNDTKTKSYSPQLKTGDLYVFSASRIHETFDIVGRHRITVASFMLWRDDLDEVLLYQ